MRVLTNTTKIRNLLSSMLMPFNVKGFIRDYFVVNFNKC